MQNTRSFVWLMSKKTLTLNLASLCHIWMGQQVKRSILDSLNEKIGSPGSPTKFYWEAKKGEI